MHRHIVGNFPKTNPPSEPLQHTSLHWPHVLIVTQNALFQVLATSGCKSKKNMPSCLNSAFWLGHMVDALETGSCKNMVKHSMVHTILPSSVTWPVTWPVTWSSQGVYLVLGIPAYSAILQLKDARIFLPLGPSYVAEGEERSPT